MRRLLHHSFRLRVEILVLASCLVALHFLGLEAVNIKAVWYKLLLLTLAVMYAHLSRKALFPYLDLSKMLNGDSKSPASVRAAGVLGGFLWVALIVLAFMLGL